MSTFSVTTPIYYVNAQPHLGHAYTTIVADCWTRYHQLLGDKTWFLTGTDEHGDKIVKAAEAAGESPQAFVDRVSHMFRDLWPRLQVRNNQFVRTTDEKHKTAVQAFLQRVYDAGDIYYGEFGGHYCTGCERFYTEKELENGLCPQHQTKPEFIEEKNYFFKMSKYLPWLKEHLQANPDFIRPERYRNEVLAMIEGGVLEDLCISRPKSRLTWGIELPFDKDYVCYVWFDALLNYISALDWPNGDAYNTFWPSEHLVAKDILKPHGVFWPTMLKSAELPLFKHLNVHGYWLSRNAKMSKSLGNAVEPLDLIQLYGLDVFRYFLLREMHFGSDATFSEDALVTRLNADLANDLGNLFSRVLSMNTKYFSGAVPPLGTLNDDDKQLTELAENAVQNYTQLFGEIRFSYALESLWELVRALNKYIDSQAPWALFKAEETERLGTVLRLTLECMRKVACCLWPIMPSAAANMLQQLGLEADEARAPISDLHSEPTRWNQLPEGCVLAAASNMFPRVELPKETNETSKETKPKKQKTTPKDNAPSPATQPADKNTADNSDKSNTIAFEDFQKLDLRVGTVQSCTQHPNADKLLVFAVDLGEEEPRQILSGIAEFFKPEDLVGKQVCVVTNLAPRKIRGLVSQGMILSAESDGVLKLLTSDGVVRQGSKIS